jgi:hypothetical protein
MHNSKMCKKGCRRGRKIKENVIKGGSPASNMQILLNHLRNQAKKKRLGLTLMMNQMGKHRVTFMLSLKNRYRHR